VRPDDEQVFTDLYEQHRTAIHAFLLGRTSDGSAASDLLQETFLRLWRNLDDVRDLEAGRQRAWLFTVARNLVVDRYRSQATLRATQAALTSEASPPDPHAPGTAERVALADQLDHLDAAIARLPVEQREVLSMTVVGGLTSQQIAAALGVPAGTVRYRLHQARRRLAADLDLAPL
jgi:RNA polymerase sigma-70 factor, ECF subfamily